MTDTNAGIPASTVQLLTPYISVHDGVEALQWYAEALGATESMRYTGDDGRIGHAEITIHGARLYLSDAYPEIGVVAATDYEGSSCALHLEVADCVSVHDRAVEHGARSLRPPGRPDTRVAYVDRDGSVRPPLDVQSDDRRAIGHRDRRRHPGLHSRVRRCPNLRSTTRARSTPSFTLDRKSRSSR